MYFIILILILILICMHLKIQLFRLGDDGPEKVSTDDLFKNKKVVLFAFPAAFTGTCANQLPGYNAKIDAFKAKGVDAVYGLSNDNVFVQKAFQKDTGADKVELLQDFNSELSIALGKTFDGSGKGLGIRNTRYSLYVENGVVKQFFEEAVPSELKVTDADTLLNALK